MPIRHEANLQNKVIKHKSSQIEEPISGFQAEHGWGGCKKSRQKQNKDCFL